jgi:hypothetical protein
MVQKIYFIGMMSILLSAILHVLSLKFNMSSIVIRILNVKKQHERRALGQHESIIQGMY